MARPLRIEFENGLYHVTVRGWERRSIVRRDRDREDWLRLLDKTAMRLAGVCVGFDDKPLPPLRAHTSAEFVSRHARPEFGLRQSL